MYMILVPLKNLKANKELRQNYPKKCYLHKYFNLFVQIPIFLLYFSMDYVWIV